MTITGMTRDTIESRIRQLEAEALAAHNNGDEEHADYCRQMAEAYRQSHLKMMEFETGIQTTHMWLLYIGITVFLAAVGYLCLH